MVLLIVVVLIVKYFDVSANDDVFALEASRPLIPPPTVLHYTSVVMLI